ncbi:DUF4189 domain-containing protein [Nocardia sp. NPDC051832]|uniref:DUF4189 domain-containing protein n=1 Tax=Nocardia sp. NPDC051832 TaxID=3155673 RepID=UPI00341F0791
MKKFATLAAIMLASLWSVMATAIPAHAQGGSYGGIAVAMSNHHFGFNTGGSNHGQAQEMAVSACLQFGGNSDCHPVLTWRNGCGALAISRTHWSYGSGASVRDASNRARANNPGVNPYIRHWACTEGYAL